MIGWFVINVMYFYLWGNMLCFMVVGGCYVFVV